MLDLHDKEYKGTLLEKSKEFCTWYLVTGYNCYGMGAFENKPEIKEVLSKLYIPVEGEFERKQYQLVRGDPRRENMLSYWTQKKWSWNEAARRAENSKGHGFGRVIDPGILSEIFCRESKSSVRRKASITSYSERNTLTEV